MPTVGLVLPTSSYRGPDFIAAADDLGVELVILSDASLGLSSGRIVAAVVADCADPAAAAQVLIDTAQVHPLDAVVGVDDAGVMIAALAASELGLPHNQPPAVAATRNKVLMRQLLADADVPQPGFIEIATPADARKAAASLGYPLVLKPVSLSGSRGVMRVDDDEQLDRALAVVGAIQVKADIIGEVLLLEEYVAGPEIAIEGLLDRDGLEVLAVFDKPDPLTGPFFEETLYVTPSRHDTGQLDDAVAAVSAATAALGLAFGPIHAEVRLGDQGPVVIEVAARSIGGLCGRSLQFGMLAQSLEVLLLRAALGLNRRGMRPAGQASGAMMIPIESAGLLRGVRGREAIAEVPGVEEITITIPVGRPVHPLPEGDRYLGFIIARGDDAEFVESALREAHGLLDIQIEPF